MSLAKIQEPPERCLILLAGPPGAGKSTFCHQVVLSSIAADRPVIFVTTEGSASDIISLLSEEGLGQLTPGALSFVDAFAATVGLATPDRPDTIGANCEDLNSMSMAIAKLQQQIARRDIVLAFDSLTSPYLFNKEEIFRFMNLCLLKFAAAGNSVLALVDEGCGKEEDLVALMSVADGIIKMEAEDGSRVLNVVKHPTMTPTRIRFLKTESISIPLQAMDAFITEHYKAATSRFQTSFRSELGDWVNVFWRSFSLWGSMLWDPKRFPIMLYELNKEITYQGAALYMTKLPRYHKLLWRFVPKRSFRSPEFFEKRIFPIMARPFNEGGEGIMEYLAGISKTDEHYVRIYEGALCWGLKNVGVPLCYDEVSYVAGMMRFFDKEQRDWNAVETTCMGEGSPYCEFRIAPGKMDELEDYLTTIDGSKIERIMDRLMEQVTEFILRGKALGERPTLGSGVHEHTFTPLPALASKRYRMAIRMGGAMTGKRLAEHLLNAGMSEDEVIKRVVDFMEYCKVGEITLDDTIRIRENCETFGLQTAQPSCFFTTGFLNGLFSTIKNQHVKETKCIAMDDPYCEWEIR